MSVTDARDGAGSNKVHPFDNKRSQAVSKVPGSVRRGFIEVGGMVQLFGQVIAAFVRDPLPAVVPTLEYTYETLKRCAVSVTIAMGGFIVFLCVAALVFFAQIGAVAAFPPIIFRVLITSFTVWAVALTLAGIVGASLTAELGARRVRDELDAMRVMGIDPIKELVVPRVLASILLTTLMSFPAIALSMLASQFAGSYFASQNAAEFQHFVYDNMVPLEMYLVIGNCFLAGIVIGVVCAYKGLTAGGGSEGLGKAVNQAVVYSFVALWIYQTLYTGITQGVFDLGRFR